MMLSKLNAKSKMGILSTVRKTTLSMRYATEVKSSATALDPVVSTERSAGISSPTNIKVQLDNVAGSILKLRDAPHTISVHDISSFDEMPGPSFLGRLARIWNAIPVLGSQVTGSTLQYSLGAARLFGGQLSWNTNLRIFNYLFGEYGPLIRLQGPFGGNVVVISRPEHASTIFENEGPYPVRSCLDSLEKYRLQHRKYNQSGPFSMFGPEWKKLRNSIETSFKICRTESIDNLENSSHDFLKRILTVRNKQDEVPATFHKEILKWSTECLCTEITNKRLGFLDPCGLSPTSDPGRLMAGIVGATTSIRECEVGLHLWKFWATPPWKRLITNCDTIDSVLQKFVQRTEGEIRRRSNLLSEGPTSLIETLLLKENMRSEDIITLLMDILIIGVNTTSHAVAILFYHLAKFPRCQAKLYEEVKNAPNRYSRDDIENMKYLKACLKESLRLMPPMPILTRVLTKNVTVHNYKIPKGTYVFMATYVSGLKEEMFEDALKFKPERWLEKESLDSMHNLAYIPFGTGPKACMAKDFAEFQIQMLTAKVIKKFRIEYCYGDIKSTTNMFGTANRPLKFRFIDRL